MNETSRALLPEGLHDDLAPAAEHEAAVLDAVQACFRQQGYQRVKPPLVEFEESLLSGPGEGLTRDMFRLMDPISQRMMGVRADMTTQVARIATTRLANAPRPLRLYYSGQVLRVRGSQLRPERQYAQAGVELIGADAVAADAEVILLAVEALSKLGVKDLSVDVTTPALPRLLAQELGLDDGQAAEICAALDQKDAAAIHALDSPAREIYSKMLHSAGRAEDVLARLDDLVMGDAAGQLIGRLKAVVAALADARPDLVVTVDPGESRGFTYQRGVSFSLFSKRVRAELGRGGRYGLETGESAVGFTFYLDSVVRAAPRAGRKDLLYIPFAQGVKAAVRWREEGWQTLNGLRLEADAESEARRLGCSYILVDDAPVALEK